MRRRNQSVTITVFAIALAIAYAMLRDWQREHRDRKEPLPETVAGKVVAVGDGDTITILADGDRLRIRLWGIDCPEMDQPWGDRAKQFTRDRALDRFVVVGVKDRDQYDRTVGVVILPGGADLNAMLVGEGLAWWYRRHAADAKELERLETEARSTGIGLWAEADPVPPWDWRRQEGR